LGFRLKYASPITQLPINFSGFAFVDNNDLLQLSQHGSLAVEVTDGLQKAVD
jgi:hypothetical protein